MDYVSAFSETWEEHITHLDALLQHLTEHEVKIARMQMRGSLVWGEKARPDPDEIAAILKLSPPYDVRGLRHLLGLTRYLESTLRVSRPYVNRFLSKRGESCNFFGPRNVI